MGQIKSGQMRCPLARPALFVERMLLSARQAFMLGRICEKRKRSKLRGL